MVRRAIRAILMSLLLLAVALPVALYLLLSTPWMQNKVRDIAVDQLSLLLGTEVEIDRIDYQPFNTLAVRGISIKDDGGHPALSVASVQARFEFWYFLRTRRLEFDYAIVDVPEVWLSRTTAGAPLNIDPILKRLAPRDKTKTPTAFDLRIATLVVRNGRFSYNVEDRAHTPSRFNPAHISLKKIGLHAYLRHITEKEYDVLLENLSFTEGSGFVLKKLCVDAIASPTVISLKEFSLALPGSELRIEPISLEIDGFSSIKSVISADTTSLSLHAKGSFATADFRCFSPLLAKAGRRIDIDIEAIGNMREISLSRLFAKDPDGMADFSLRGRFCNIDSLSGLTYDIPAISLNIEAADAARIASRIAPTATRYFHDLSELSLEGSLSGDMSKAALELSAEIDRGRVDLDGYATFSPGRAAFVGSVAAGDIPAGAIFGDSRLGDISVPADISLSWSKGTLPTVKATVSDASVQWLGRTFGGLFVHAEFDNDFAAVQCSSSNPGIAFTIDADARHSGRSRSLDLSAEITDFQPEVLGLKIIRPGLAISGSAQADLEGSSLDDIIGRAALSNVLLTAGTDSLSIGSLELQADGPNTAKSIVLTGDYINGSLEGQFTPSLLPDFFKEIASHVVPSVVAPEADRSQRIEDLKPLNNFNATFTIANAEPLCRFFHLPVTAVYPVDINFALCAPRETMTLTFDAPYLQQGDKIIDSTTLGLRADASTGSASLFASTHMPTKKGPMAVSVGIEGSVDSFSTTINWEIERAIPLNGVIAFDTSLSRSGNSRICVDTHMLPGQINFGDDVWSIEPSEISWCDSRLSFHNFALNSGKQRIAIDGTASASEADIVTVDLHDIVLVSIFETLEIENALLTGTASGTFTASSALSKMPRLSTPCLHVDDIGYNYCVLGNADIKASWDNARQGFRLDADITNPEGQLSQIGGYIFPSGESLDLDFNANHVKIGFMQPFMKAFASDITGHASGHARLFGTFHDIDMEGDIYAEDLRLRLDFTNTYYSTTDSVHIRPGVINLSGIVLHDDNGNTARLDGILTHTFFHYPEFEFNISDARNFLCYNVTPRLNPDWYGTVYGNGGASVKGKPGIIDIGVNMTTTEGSTFTFVLSDRLEAEQYSFITFRDVTDYSARETLLTHDDTPEVVREFQKRMRQQAVDPPSNYIMDIRVDITPEAQVNLVMDPVGGDRIRAYGSGDLRMSYNAFENDLRMYGTYTLDQGSYNFTLQDIIIKDFSIEPGSSIAFHGDPYSAQLNIEAVYQVNANLSDLDKSFTMDKELNRTNVPVQALMKVTGDMRQPDLAFDLRFPTLTSDTYRKVRSIISTDDMMNRQIIYLLALNRFYTPDYMETTKGNELFSVASSTISSQLSSMLGKLSENWSIAPNLRSDQGNFKDVEVDVALSSRLLNNRLLFNGNFGYRDKSLNTNQFIGDFDIEYLLNPKGNWRLKAYNRYNDQNYYVRTATTTQGVGIMFRRDFDDLFGRHREQCPPREYTAPSDTVAAPSDSTAIKKDNPAKPKE